MQRTALVTGATAGFGAAICRTLIENGYRVIGTGRRVARLEQLQQELDDEIVDKTKIVNKVINTYEVENGVDIYVTYEVLENIGTNEKIVF